MANENKNALGLSVGIPHTIAVTYQRSLNANFSGQLHAGSVVFLSSAGIRINWIKSRHGFSPYFFVGQVLIHIVAFDAGNPDGTTDYLWLGPGIQYSQEKWKIYAEVCGLFGGDEDKGLGDDWVFPGNPAIAGGLMIKF